MATPQERKFAFSYVERGKQFVAAKHYPDALEALREATRRDPEIVEAWILLALTHYRLSEYGECLGAADEALKYDSANGDAWNYRGLALLRLGRPGEAFVQFIHGANLYQSDPAFALNAGSALHDLRRYDLALIWSERALTLPSRYWPDPYWKAANSSAIDLIYLGRFEEAATQLASVAAVATDQSKFWATTGLLHIHWDQYDDALIAIKRAIELDPNDPSGWERMAELLVALEDYAKALGVATHGLELRPYSRELLEQKAKALRGLGRESEAEEIERAAQARLAEQLALLDQIGGL